MFVEGIRLFVVVLGTAAGFWASRNFGTQAQGLGGMLGCLLGYVSGGSLGRVLDKGLGGDEMGERVRLVIDGVDGRVHHIEMDAARAE